MLLECTGVIRMQRKRRTGWISWTRNERARETEWERERIWSQKKSALWRPLSSEKKACDFSGEDSRLTEIASHHCYFSSGVYRQFNSHFFHFYRFVLKVPLRRSNVFSIITISVNARYSCQCNVLFHLSYLTWLKYEY